jgi:hypothetical protein
VGPELFLLAEMIFEGGPELFLLVEMIFGGGAGIIFAS